MIQPKSNSPANRFTARLNAVIEAVINTDVRFVANQMKDISQSVIRPARSFRGTDAFPLRRSDEDPEGTPAILLNASYIVDISGEGEHLSVNTSTIGLWVDVTGGRKSHRPLIRLEYDRDTRSFDRPAAHVHLHANSPEMAWVYGSSGRSAPDLHALHFPVGGQRFRPTLEDFLLFLNREDIYKEFRSGWERSVKESLQDWERDQVNKTAQKYPGDTADALRELGYEVSLPGLGA